MRQDSSSGPVRRFKDIIRDAKMIKNKSRIKARHARPHYTDFGIGRQSLRSLVRPPREVFKLEVPITWGLNIFQARNFVQLALVAQAG